MTQFSWDIGYYCRYRCSYCFFSDWDRAEEIFGAARTPETVELAWRKVRELCGESLIRITGGEPQLYPGFAAIVRRLSALHRLHVTTSLSLEPDDLIAAADPSRVELNATYHPRHAAIEEFAGRVEKLRAAGFNCGVCYLAHPAQLREMLFCRKYLLRRGIGMAVTEFQGDWNGKRYPGAYAPAERLLMRFAGGWGNGAGDLEQLAALRDGAREDGPGCAAVGMIVVKADGAMTAVDRTGKERPCGNLYGPIEGPLLTDGIEHEN